MMSSYTPTPAMDVAMPATTVELIRLLREEAHNSKTLAQDLQVARETNQKYLEALADRDRLIQEYIETIQKIRANSGETV